MSEFKSKSGKQAIIFNAVRGALIEGDGIAALADNAWFIINAYAAVSTLPYEDVNSTTGRIFKSPDSGNAITPAIGDDVYPITLTKICKADASVATEKGTIDVTDDCEQGYNAMIVDGFTDISGDIAAFLKFNVPGGGIAPTQEEFLNRFWDIQDDDGAGVYVLTAKNDDDIFLAILQNSDQIAENDIQVWLMVPAILSSNTLDKPLKGVQNFDFSWVKAQGPASVYQRTTNATETVF